MTTGSSLDHNPKLMWLVLNTWWSDVQLSHDWGAITTTIAVTGSVRVHWHYHQEWEGSYMFMYESLVHVHFCHQLNKPLHDLHRLLAAWLVIICVHCSKLPLSFLTNNTTVTLIHWTLIYMLIKYVMITFYFGMRDTMYNHTDRTSLGYGCM